MKAARLTHVGVVAIGRNEGQRLVTCLRSLLDRVGAVCYVDSGSTDGSAAAARAMGVVVVELDMARPFTAARARNAGLDRLLECHEGIRLAQMVDGDCEVVEGWLEVAAARLETHPRLGTVCGRLRERYTHATVYNQLADMEWDTPIGAARSCGGIAMFRVAALRQVGGYDPSVIAGEEPELCVRLRARGWNIERLDAEMALHDAAMTRFSQWWKRSVRSGHAYANGMAMHGGPPERHNVKAVGSIVFWSMVLPAVIVAAVIGGLFIGPLWLLAAVALLGYPLLAVRVWLHRRQHGDAPGPARTYALFTVIGKFANARGLLQFAFNRLRGRQGRIIEYKAAGMGNVT